MFQSDREKCVPAESRRWRGLWGISLVSMILLLWFAIAAHAAEPNFPVLSGRVVDDAGILNGETIEKLTGMLEQHEQATGEQVVVVTLKSLGGYSIEDYGYRLGRNWGIGQKGKNTGAILIVVPSEHKVRIEVGYGLEGKLTDAISRSIIESEIVGNFRRGDFNAGVLAGTASILTVLGGRPVTGSDAETANGSPGPAGTTSGWSFPLLMVIFFIFMLIRSLFRPRYGLYRRGYGTYGGGFGGGSGGGGGFSGGGGSFGGGGASGSW
jgi:uncharacterized protein